MLDVITIIILLVALFASNRRIAARHPQMSNLGTTLNQLLVYHFIFIVVFTVYIVGYGGDSYSYWIFAGGLAPVKASQWFDYFGLGTVFVEFLCYVPVKIFGLSYFTGNCLFGALGFLGIRYLYLLFRMTLPLNVNVFGKAVLPFLFYLPNLHFWVGGVGKDSVCFFCIAWFIYSLQFFRQKWIGACCAFFLLFFTRPHIGFVVIAGSLIGVLFSGRVKMVYKILFSVLVIFVFYLIYDTVIGYLKIGELNTETLSNAAILHAKGLRGKSVGSSIDLENYSWPGKIFTYLFRPLFFDAKDVMSLTISVENLIYLVIAVMGFSAFKWKYLSLLPVWLKTGFIIFLMTTIMFSTTLSNLGIAIRMKNMTMIYFLMTMISFISLKRMSVRQAVTIKSEPSWGVQLPGKD